MPIYEYKCTLCDERFEVEHSIKDKALTTIAGADASHPKGKHPVKKVFHAPGIAFKGEGFYKNDSRKKKSTSSSSESTGASTSDSSGSDSSTSGSKGSESAGTKTDTKSKAKTDGGSKTSTDAGSKPAAPSKAD